MLVLPVELREHVIEPLELNELANLRATGSKALYELTTPLVFRHIRVSNDDRGFKVLKEAATCDIASVVQDVHVSICEHKSTGGQIQRIPSAHQTYGKEKAFANIACRFPSLTHLKISFRDDPASFAPQMERMLDQVNLMDNILSDPKHRPSRLTALTVHAMLFPWAFNNFFLRDGSAADVLSSLTHLSIHFNSVPVGRIPADFLSSYHKSARLRSDFPVWQLTHLTLSTIEESIHFAPIDPTILHFPNLKSLMIDNMAFRTPFQNVFQPTEVPGAMEEFVVRHTNLRKLVLRDCMLVHMRRPWSVVYDRIASALTQLLELSVEFRPPRREQVNGPHIPNHTGSHTAVKPDPGVSLGYCDLRSMRVQVNRGQFVRGFIKEPAVVLRDKTALEKLKAKVEERARAKNKL